MDTFIRASNPHLATIIQIMHRSSILPTEERMEPEGEAEVEGGEKGIEVLMRILVAPAPGGKSLEVTLVRTVATTEVRGAFTQGHIPWMDPMDPAGEEKMQAGIWNKPMKTRMPGLKNPGSLARSKGEDTTMKRALA